jgi:hypothetical protein
MMISLALLLAGSAFMIQPASAASFNNVQIFATTTNTLPYNFQFAAYNLSGSLIASYQGPYPAAAFELPSGGYLFTVSAVSSYPRLCNSNYPCPLVGGASNGQSIACPVTGGPAKGTTSPTAQGSSSAYPIWCGFPSTEYGYATATVGGPQTINIQLKNISEFPTTPVTVKVSYVNGTAAAGASVYASIVGEWYYWVGPNASVNMSGTTDNNGVAHLVLPVAPAVITAWKWVPISSNTNGTVTTTIGGEKITVTVYWQPTYVGLSGSGLLLPPQNSMSIVLHYQQPNYWVMPAGVNSKGAYSGGASQGTVASQPSGVPSLASPNSAGQSSSGYYLPSQIPAVQQVAGTESATGLSQTGVLVVGGALFAAGAAAVALMASRRRLHRPSTPTG